MRAARVQRNIEPRMWQDAPRKCGPTSLFHAERGDDHFRKNLNADLAAK